MRLYTSSIRLLMLIVLSLSLAACGTVRTGGDAAPGEAPAEEEGPRTRTLQGYKIQVGTTQQKGAADQLALNVLDWWRTVPEQQRPPYHESDDLDVEVEWQQPYYRVRVGNFASRAEAQNALDLFRNRWQEAFVVPTIVTITR